MAISKGRTQGAFAPAKKYIGIGNVRVVACNPTPEEYEKIYGYKPEKDFQYTSTREIDGANVPQIRLEFHCKLAEGYKDSEGNPAECSPRLTFFITKYPMYNRDKTKAKIIDNYGRTAWATIEDIKAKKIPVYTTGPAHISSNYRMVMRGEEELIVFLKTYLGIPGVDKWDNGVIVGEIANPSDAECFIEDWNTVFKGDVSVFKDAVQYQPLNEVKLMFGVRSNDTGSMFQTVCNAVFASGTNPKNNVFTKYLKEAEENGRLNNTEFEAGDLHEYKVAATDFTKPQDATDDLPFSEGTSSDPFANVPF